MVKLLKYEFRAINKVFLFIWPGMLLLSLFERLLFSFEIENPAILVFAMLAFILFMFALIGALIFSIIFSTVRFYSGLLGKEGYLMHTLPTKTWKLLLSKLIPALTTITVTLLVMFACIYILVSGFMESLAGEAIFPDLKDLLGPSIPIAALNYLVSILCSTLQIYLACCLGHLFRKHRVLWSVLMYYGLNMVVQFVTTMLTFAILLGKDSHLGLLEPSSLMNETLLTTLPLQLCLSILFFFLCEFILRKKLNLE